MSTPAEHPAEPHIGGEGRADLDPMVISCQDHHQADRLAEQRTGLCTACLADLELVLSGVP